jgi:hypothetical protein
VRRPDLVPGQSGAAGDPSPDDELGEALIAARSRSIEALVKANSQLVDSCESCHKQFKPEVPTEGKTHQPH